MVQFSPEQRPGYFGLSDYERRLAQLGIERQVGLLAPLPPTRDQSDFISYVRNSTITGTRLVPPTALDLIRVHTALVKETRRQIAEVGLPGTQPAWLPTEFAGVVRDVLPVGVEVCDTLSQEFPEARIAREYSRERMAPVAQAAISQLGAIQP